MDQGFNEGNRNKNRKVRRFNFNRFIKILYFFDIFGCEKSKNVKFCSNLKKKSMKDKNSTNVYLI